MENRQSRTPDLRGPLVPQSLVQDIRQMIQEARAAVALTVNAALSRLYWRIGRRIQAEILKGGRAEYGEQILATLSQELTQEYGKGFSYSALTRMVRFAEVFPEEALVATLSQQLSWSHVREIITLGQPLQREFSHACLLR